MLPADKTQSAAVSFCCLQNKITMLWVHRLPQSHCSVELLPGGCISKQISNGHFYLALTICPHLSATSSRWHQAGVSRASLLLIHSRNSTWVHFFSPASLSTEAHLRAPFQSLGHNRGNEKEFINWSAHQICCNEILSMRSPRHIICI